MKKLLFALAFLLSLPGVAYCADIYGTAVYGSASYHYDSYVATTLGANNTNTYCFYQKEAKLVIPETATGCTVNNNTIYGMLEVSETVTIENCFVYLVELAGVGAAETVTFNNCAFVQSEAEIDAELGAGGATSYTDCLFSQNVSDLFRDFANNDYHPTMGSALKNAGKDTGAGTDLDGHTTPSGSAHDIGCYELVGRGKGQGRMGMGLQLH